MYDWFTALQSTQALRATCGDDIATLSIQCTRRIPGGQEGLFEVPGRVLERRKNEKARKREDLVTIRLAKRIGKKKEEKRRLKTCHYGARNKKRKKRRIIRIWIWTWTADALCCWNIEMEYGEPDTLPFTFFL